jgi:hypothetical protein
MRYKIRRTVLFAVLTMSAASIASPCRAQEFRATITGVVTDSAKAVIPAASVTVHNLDTNEVVTTKSSGVGVYSVSYLHPAQRYEVSVEAPGFKKTTHPAVVLSISQTITIDFSLQVGAATQEVTVSASESQVALDSEKGDRGFVVDNKTITELPIDGRNPLALLDEVAGVTNENGPGFQGPPTDMYNASFYTINGGAAQNTEYTIDGMPDNSIPWWSSGPSAIPSVDAIQEFKVITNPYDAQFGRTSGGVVSMELKSGTNSLHGSAYEFAKRGYMDANTWANNYYGLNRPGHTEDQYGAEIAGPVYLPRIYHGQNKTFFMFNAELLRQKLPYFATFDVANPAWITGDFSNFTDSSGNLFPVYDPATATTANPARNVFQTAAGYNHVPAGRLNPIAVNILNMIAKATPITANAVPGELPWESIWVDTLPKTQTMDNYISKVDQVIGGKDRLSFSYIHDVNLVQFLDTPAGPWENGEHFQENHQNAGIDWVHTQRANLLFDVHTSYQRYWRSDGYPSTWGYDATQLGFPSSTINQLPLKTGFPQITWTMQEPGVASGAGYGQWMGLSRDRYFIPDDTFSLAPTVTWNKGKHNLRAGADLRSTHTSADTNWTNILQMDSNGEASSELWNSNGFDDQTPLPNGKPTGIYSGNAYLDFLLGQPDSVSVTNQLNPTYTWHYIAPWVQDDWKVTSRLTLNLGFRYDLNGPPTARHDWLSTGFDLNATNPVNSMVNHAAFPGIPAVIEGGYTFPATSGTSLPWARDYTKVQPRLGFAYSIHHDTVLRGGAGRLVMSPMGDQPSQVGYQQYPVFLNTVDGGRTYINDSSANGTLTNPFPTGVPAIPGASQGLMTNVGLGVGFSNPHYKLPYVYQYSLGLQQAIPGDGKLEISYVGSRSEAQDYTFSALNTNETLFKSCNALLGTASNPNPRTACENQVPNPFYNIPGVQGGLGAYPTQSVLQLASPYPEFGGISEAQMNWGLGWYNSMQTTYEQRTGWEQLNGSWTWSKTTQSGGFVDQNYLVPNRSIAGTDRTNRVTLTGVLNVPVGRGKKYFGNMSRLLDIPLGGWELGQAMFWESGEPFPLASGFNPVGNIKAPKINAPGIINLGVNQCVWLWQAATSTTPGFYSLFTGNGASPSGCPAGQGWFQQVPYGPNLVQSYTDLIRLPGANQLDLNLAKMFKFTEHLSMQTRLETTNVLNHPNWYWGYANYPTGANFGYVNKAAVGQTNNPRYVQLAVKLLW